MHNNDVQQSELQRENFQINAWQMARGGQAQPQAGPFKHYQPVARWCCATAHSESLSTISSRRLGTPDRTGLSVVLKLLSFHEKANAT